ncbi:hypothetical protein QE152_g38489 [Popillia japonica]|uniref:Uncharacterized protein n=1 Tax=Popillia japonica TaxID=7064 RepID=A0AAW1HXL3_POPJA
MKSQLHLRGFVVIFVLLLVQCSLARPSSRIKRVSDQRLAELETQLGLQEMKGQLVTVPLAFGIRKPHEIGRKRRSESRLLDLLLNRSSEDNIGDPYELNYEDLYRQKR